MNFRKISIVAGVSVLVLAFFVGKKISSDKPEIPVAKTGIIQMVNAMPVVNTSIRAEIPVTGKLEALNRIEIYSEVSGIYKQPGKAFKEGYAFAKGETLINLDSEEALQTLLAQRSLLFNQIAQMMPDLKIDYPEDFEKWNNYLINYDLKNSLKELPEPANNRSRYFITSNNIYSQFYTIKSMEEKLSKYKISAPFSGVVSQSSVNPGTLVRVGQKLGEFISPYEYELVTNIAAKDLSFAKIGNQVDLTSSDIKGSWKGTISRISESIDATTQTVKIFVNVKGNDLKEGMFLTGAIHIGHIQDAKSIPRNILFNHNELYLIKDSLLKRTVIDVVRIAADSAIIKGLPNGSVILNESIPGAFDGMKVQANFSPK